MCLAKEENVTVDDLKRLPKEGGGRFCRLEAIARNWAHQNRTRE